MARPKKPIDETELRKLAMIGCTMNEMASWFECSVDTLERRFADIIRDGKEHGKSSVRRMIWKQAELNGNAVCIKYLIHNVLKERLNDDTNIAIPEGGIKFIFEDYTRKDPK